MKNNIFIFFLFAIAFSSCNQSINGDLVKYVNPLIGTGPSTTISNTVYGDEHVNYANAQVIPAVTMPFGMTNWTPQTHDTEEKCYAPYYYTEIQIQGFRGSHWLSGSCTQDYGSVTIMPITGDLKCQPELRASRYTHEDEISTPAYYSINLLDYDIQAELTATTRAAIFRFTFNNEKNASIIINPNSDEGLGYIKIDPAKNEIMGYNPVHRIYQGWGEHAGFKGYFVAKFAKPFKKHGVFYDYVEKNNQTEIKNKTNLGAFVSFDTEPNEQILVKIGTSFTSLEQARKNLDEEIPDWDFEKTRTDLENVWNKLLGRFEIYDAAPDDLTKFYTALYHCFQQPRIFNDADGSFVRFDGGNSIHKTADFDYFADFSMWDTYRALHPLYTIILPGKTSEMVKSTILKAEQGGWLPIFPLFNSYTSAMIGDHMISFIGDAIVKGIDDFDVEKAYSYMRKNAFKSPPKNDYIDGKGRRSLKSYMKHGFIPMEDTVEYAFHDKEQASRTLEYAYDDFVLAQVAKKLGKNDDYSLLKKRALNYRNIFDPSLGYARGRNQDLSWYSEFELHESMDYITEGTPLHYSWYVPHDVDALIDIMGGVEEFNARLDTFFVTHNYWHGNEPGHQTVYMYNYSGQPYKTQYRVRRVLEEEYTTGPGGLSGNDDSGQMSAWYVFSVLGFYPVCPGTPYYVIGSPGFNRVEIKLEDGKKFKVIAKNNSKENCYIKSAKLNGKPYDLTYISHFDILKGGQLEFEMTNDPNTGWGCDPGSVPFSMSSSIWQGK